MEYLVTKNERVGENCYRLTLDFSKDRHPPIPGQFYNIRCTGRMDPLLRRPFSMHRLTKENGIPCFQILYRVIGKGTDWLSSRKNGETLDLIGPLGNGFHIERRTDVVLAARGIGIAPCVPLPMQYGPWLLKRVFTFSWVPGLKIGFSTGKNLSASERSTSTRTTGASVFTGGRRNFFFIFWKQGKCLEVVLSMRAALPPCSWNCPPYPSASASRARSLWKRTWDAALEPASPVRSPSAPLPSRRTPAGPNPPSSGPKTGARVTL